MLPVVFEGQRNFTFIPSETTKGKSYRVYIDRYGALRCNCPDGIFRPKKMCKHALKAIKAKP